MKRLLAAIVEVVTEYAVRRLVVAVMVEESFLDALDTHIDGLADDQDRELVVHTAHGKRTLRLP